MAKTSHAQASDAEATRSSQWPPWIAAIVASATLGATVYFHHVDRQATQRDKLLEHRREAVFAALRVVDHVYSNEPITGRPPSNPHEWDIQSARDAMNQIIVYCSAPRTLELFKQAVGLYNPDVEKPPGVDLKALDAFRRQAARELELPEPAASDPNKIWIYHLAGSK